MGRVIQYSCESFRYYKIQMHGQRQILSEFFDFVICLRCCLIYLFQKTDDFIGEAELALDGLVKGQEKLQWVKLRKVPHGEVQIGLKPITFGLEPGMLDTCFVSILVFITISGSSNSECSATTTSTAICSVPCALVRPVT